MAFSQLCQLHGGCMGCCGYKFPSLEEVEEVVTKNTLEFIHFNPQNEEEFLAFRDREKGSFRNGLCRNIVREEWGVGCCMHPSLHKGKELRKGFCDFGHLCMSAKEFASWSEEEKKKFLTFLESKELDSASYSLGMKMSTFLEEFKQKKETQPLDKSG